MGKMNSKAISLLTLGLVCALGVLGSMRLANRGYETNAVTPQTNLRIYACLDGDWSMGGDDPMYITYEGTAITPVPFTSAIQMTKVVSDYGEGLFYYDVPIGFDSDDQFRLRNATGAWTGDHNQTDYINFSSLKDGTNFKAIRVGAWVADGVKRTTTIADTLPGNSGQIAAILNHIDSCSDSYAGGYNAWSQLNDLFISSSTLVGSTVVTDNFGESTTITDKCAYLQTRYNIDQAS